MLTPLRTIFIITATVLFTGISAQAEEELKSISYNSLPSMIANDEIEKIDIYDSGINDRDAIVHLKDGKQCVVKKPHGLDQDVVFQQHLTEHNIDFVVYDHEYGSPNSTRNFTFAMFIPMILMFGIPIILILIIWKQSRTISKQAETINRLTNDQAG